MRKNQIFFKDSKCDHSRLRELKVCCNAIRFCGMVVSGAYVNEAGSSDLIECRWRFYRGFMRRFFKIVRFMYRLMDYTSKEK
ncbi:MAG: hypothetical protein C4527_23285 [Candidatus Omnitrophota bacterium]|nr:MAG: hypothetical protein C4527_23285 [Candidatus Omnitrophota bacterium]